MGILEAIGEALVALPSPFGMIVTGLLSPPLAFLAGLGAYLARRRGRTVLSAILAAIAVVAVVGTMAFLVATDFPSGP
jgi:hypothetical protein